MPNKKIRLEILEKMSQLATAGFGLVAALAWNSAIQDIFKKVNIFGEKDSVYAKIAYAVVVTIIVVAVIYVIGKWVDELKEELRLSEQNDAEEKLNNKKSR